MRNKAEILKSLYCMMFLLIMPLVWNIPSYAALESIPVTQNLDNQNNRYNDLFTGSATYSYPIKIPAGTNNLTPSVTFSYNSHNTYDARTRNGLGWQYNKEYIERDTNHTVANTADDLYKLHFQGTTYDLVYVGSDGHYHTKIESHLNIVRLAAGGQNGYGEYWIIITPDGNQYRFGYQSSSELICNGRNYVSEWNLDQVTDTHDNHIYYTYALNSGNTYISKIEYNNDTTRSVEFNYDTSPYQRTLYTNGCQTQDAARLSSVNVKVGTTLVHQYTLGYNNADNAQPLLSSITEKGNDGTSSLPSTTLTYNQEIKSWNSTAILGLNNAPIDAHLNMQQVRLLDVNGDGLPDIVKSAASGARSTWYVWKNQGNDTWSTSAENWLNNADIEADLLRAYATLTDVNGDALPDIVKSQDTGNGTTTWSVWKNTGSSWNTTAEVWLDHSTIPVRLDDSEVRLIDVTGDGLPDFVKSTYSGNKYTWKVWRNTGSSWSASSETWINNAEIDAYLPYTNLRMIDINGDGLADIVKSIQNGGCDTWEALYNTGTSWQTTYTVWLNNACIDAHLNMSQVSLADVNGDNLPDIIKVDQSGPNNTWKILLNKGNTWETSWTNWMNNVPMDSGIYMSDVRLADINGDGLLDIVKTIQNGGSDTWKIWKNNGIAPNRLATIHTSQGSTQSFEYARSTQYDNTGSDNLPDLPFPLYLLSKVTVSNGMNGAQSTTGETYYTYTDGAYDYQDREFRGFGTVSVTKPNGTRVTTLFKQDDALKGRSYQTETKDSSNNPYLKQENVWSSTSSDNVYTVKLDQEKKYTYDGTYSNPKITQTDYEYDTYGNTTKISEHGDTGLTGDERYTYIEYVPNTSTWLINKPKHTYTKAANDTTKVSEQWFYYDTNTQLTDLPTKGDITKKVEWLQGGTNPITTYTYNTHGNKLTETDANNHTTTTTYGTNDPTFTYPDTVTNAKQQTITSTYDLGTGNLLSQTDANGATTSYSYDVFGRITKEIKPYDTSTYPTTTYQYDNDGNAPETTKVSKREVSGASGTLDIYTFVDGLNRTVQTRADAQDTTKQIVLNTFYNNAGLISTTSVPHLDALSTAYASPITSAKYTQMTYDPIDRLTVTTNPDNTTKSIAYNHWIITNTNENGHQTRHHKNAYDNIVQVDEIDGNTTNTTTYTYNTRKELTRITDAQANNIDFSYDTLGRKTGMVDSDLGSWSYNYDAVGNQTSQTDNRTITTTKTYDELNRVTQINYPNDTDISYTYDTVKAGTLAQVTDAAGTVTYTYDNRLRKTQEQRVMDATTWTTAFTYDAMDRPVTQTNPDNQTITYTYNNQGEVSGINTILTNVNYNALGKVTKKEFANGVSTDYTYNTTDFRLNKIKTADLQELSYTYDSAGNLSSITNNLTNKTQNYTYDNLERLTSASESNGYTYGYAYNSIGNMTTFTNNGTDITYTYGQNAGVHALTHSTETQTSPSSTPTPSSTASPTPSQSSYIIYDDALSSGWEDWSWSATNNFNNTTNPQTGTKSISWTNTAAYGGFYLHKNSNLSTAGYDNLSFALKATQSGQQVQVQLYDSSGNTIGTPLFLDNYGGDPNASAYKTYTIPLSVLGGANTSIRGVLIQDKTGSMQPALYIDNMKLTANTQNQEPAQTHHVYTDSLQNNWQDWSWDSTNNFSDTTAYSGTNNINWQTAAGYGGLFLHKSTGFNTTGYDTLTFAAKATQSGQQIQIQLYDNNDASIGSPLSLANYGGNPTTAYTVYTIPLSALNGSNRTINGLAIQNTANAASPSILIDEISFTGASGSIPTPTPTPTPSPTPSQPPVTNYSIYADSLAAGWQDWSWSSSNNLSDTHPNGGSNNISWTTSAGYAGLYLHSTSNITIANYTSLAFDLKATTSGPSIQVQLYDTAGNVIGNPIALTNYGGDPVTTAYRSYIIPLSVLKGSNTSISGILIQDKTGSAQSAVYVDSVQLLGN